MPGRFVLTPGRLGLAELRASDGENVEIDLDPVARPPIEESRVLIADLMAEGRHVYGLNTGFGQLAKTTIPADQVRELQRRLVLSTAAGTGPLLSDRIVRRVIVLKVSALGLGLSGVRPVLIEALLAFYNAGVSPCVPAKGSAGASGDLAPLAHLAAALLGEGDVRIDGETAPASAGLERAGLAPLVLEAKEGLALVNGTEVSTVLALEGLFAAEDAFAAAVVAGSLSAEAALTSDDPFDPRIHAARGQSGQTEVAAVYRSLLRGSGIRESHLECDRVQDPYSLRCQPQVMGACLDHMRFAAEVLAREVNGVRDNPLVFAEEREILSGGNFHAQPVAMAADTLALAIAETGSLSERRTALLVDPSLSQLPPFLVRDSGLNSGFMVAQITAAALVSENKALAHPASVDSIPTSANQEDHVSMATYAARRLGDMADNAAAIVAIELLAACQGIEFRRPLTTTAALEEAVALVRARVPPYEEDRFFAPDIAAAKALVTGGIFRELVPAGLLPSQAP